MTDSGYWERKEAEEKRIELSTLRVRCEAAERERDILVLMVQGQRTEAESQLAAANGLLEKALQRAVTFEAQLAAATAELERVKDALEDCYDELVDDTPPERRTGKDGRVLDALAQARAALGEKP